jgi:hypothetical protein
VAPAALAVAASGNVYVFDDGNSRIVKLSRRGRFLAEFGATGPAEVRVSPGGFSDSIYVDRQENVYVADAGNPRIQIFNSNGSLVRSFRVPFPIDSVAVNSAGEIFVAVSSNRNIPLVYVFSDSGQFRRTIGERIVKASGSLSKSVNRAVIDIDAGDNLFLAFRHWPLVRKYSAAGNLLSESGFSVPPQLIPDAQRNMYSLEFIAKYPNSSYALPFLVHSISASRQGVAYVLVNGHNLVKIGNPTKLPYPIHLHSSSVPPSALFTRLVRSPSGIFLLDTRSGNIYVANGL